MEPVYMDYRIMTDGSEIARDGAAELVNLYHLARTALAGRPGTVPSTYDRMLWASDAYAREHPGVSKGHAYKALDRALHQ